MGTRATTIRTRRIAMALMTALAVGSAGLSTAGCGDDNGKTQSTVEQRAEEAGKGVEKGTRELEDSLEQAGEGARGGVEKAKEEAEKALDEARRQGE